MRARRLPDLLTEAVQRYGDRPALAIRRGLRTQVWSYRQLADDAAAAAERLRETGLRPGDQVAVLAPNSPELVASMFGAWVAGGVLVPIDVRTPADVIARIAEQSAPRLAIASATSSELGAIPIVDPLELVTRCQTEAATSGCRSNDSARPELAEIVFTSGTTGAPKGVMLTHENILANVESAVEAMPIQVGERLLSLLPLSHMLEQTSGLLAALASGATIFYTTSRRSTAIMSALQRHQIGLLVCVPEVLRLLLNGIEREIERRGQTRRWERSLELSRGLPFALRRWLFRSVYQRLGGRLHLVLCGGARLEPELWQTWENLGVRVVQGYGTTECAPVVTSNRLHRRLADSAGWPVKDVQLRLAPDGEILVRGPNVTPGYWRDPTATAEALREGWYHTGDLGRLGSRGELQLLGRKKEMIVLADGRNVFPQDVEAALRADPAIKDCAVIGRSRPGGGVEVHAVLLPAQSTDEQVTDEIVRAAVRRANTRLAPHQQVGGMTIWPEADFPRTSSLKIKKADLLGVVERSASSASTRVPAPEAIGDLATTVRALLARASGKPVGEIQPESDLTLDLGMDSLARVELAVLLEETMGWTLSDEEMVAQRTVADLCTALGGGSHATTAELLPAWPRQRPTQVLRALTQSLLLFPYLRSLCRPLKVHGREHLKELRGPALLIANHTSHLDSLAVLAILPARRRRRIAVAAAADYFFTRQPLAFLTAFLLGGFPFQRQSAGGPEGSRGKHERERDQRARSGGAHGTIASSLSHCGDLVDAGHSILIFPEGTRSPDGRLQPLKSGIGLLATQLGVPVLPIHIQGLHAILPKGRTLPKPGPVRVQVGAPLRIETLLTPAEATEQIQSVLEQLARRNGPVSEPWSP